MSRRNDRRPPSDNAQSAESSIAWITRAEAGKVAPGLTPQRLDYIRREALYSSKITAPPARMVSDGEVIYDELAFRRWLESTVSWEWMHGQVGPYRSQPTGDRLHASPDQRKLVTSGAA